MKESLAKSRRKTRKRRLFLPTYKKSKNHVARIRVLGDQKKRVKKPPSAELAEKKSGEPFNSKAFLR